MYSGNCALLRAGAAETQFVVDAWVVLKTGVAVATKTRGLVMVTITRLTATLLICTALHLQVPSKAPTGLTFDATVVDLGRLTPGAVCDVAFHYQNRTAAAIRVIRVGLECGCLTEVNDIRTTVLPESDGVLQLRLTAPRHAAAVASPIVIVDGQQHEDRLHVRFSVAPFVELGPSHVVESRLLSDRPLHRAVRVIGSPERVTTIETDSDQLHARYDRAAGLIQLELAPAVALGPARYRVHVHTQDPVDGSRQVLELPVEVTTNAPVRVAPATLDLGAVSVGSAVTGKVSVRNLFAPAYRLAVKSIDRPTFVARADVNVVDGGIELAIRVEVPADRALLAGHLRVTLDDAVGTVVVIPVTALVAGVKEPSATATSKERTP